MRPGFKIGNFVIEKNIGSGSFASVWAAQHVISKSPVAIKVIVKSSISSAVAVTRLQREIALLKQMEHPFIAEFFQVIENDEYYFLVMEYVQNGNLLDYVNNNGRLSEDQARRYFGQLVSVLEYLHEEKKVAHRDLKCENVLLDKYNNIRLIDFGLSNIFTDDSPELSTACGSPAYVAPEMILRNPYTISADIWSSGILLFAIIAGHLPFDDENVQRLLHKIVYSDVSYPSFMSAQLVDLLSKMLCKDPNNRITLEKIKEHPWFSPAEYSALQAFVKSNRYQTANVNPNDWEIINQMTSLGVECHDLHQSLLNGEFNEKIALYRILLREKMVESMKDIMVKVQQQAQVPFKQANSIQAVPLMRPPMRPPAHPPTSNQPKNAMKMPAYGQRPSMPSMNPNGQAQSPRHLASPILNNTSTRRLSRPVTVRRSINLPNTSVSHEA
ncbi:hypothetical protein M9Y10_012775 [Tritrichomonas musculus]|uniref:Protein kinase domain-containing protein n=1 Tax=Tritrichomonas musculus TaxID=1915356 RepID=A0ABR2IEI0_9EUKA